MRLFQFITVEGKCVGIIWRQVFFEGVDCVPVMLDCTLDVSFLGVLGGMVVSGMVGSGCVRYIFRGMRIYFSQDHWHVPRVEEFQRVQHLQCQRRIAELFYYYEGV